MNEVTVARTPAEEHSATEVVLRVKDLRKIYGGAAVVDGFSFTLRRGECYALLGPNGAGKTTTLRCCLGLTDPDGGAIELLGEPIPRRAREARIRIGVVPQLDNLDPDFTVREITSALFKAKPGEPVDLSKHDLTYLDLSGLNFKAAKLSQSDLYGADFTDANLRGTDLSGTRLDRATLIRADFSGANLSGASILRPTVYTDLTENIADAPPVKTEETPATKSTLVCVTLISA